MTVLGMFAALFLPRQVQVMVEENVGERHLRRAVWVLRSYLLLINLVVLLRMKCFGVRDCGNLTSLLLGIRCAAILGIMLPGYLYDRLAGEAYPLVSIGLISFAAVAQFAPAILGGIDWRGGTRSGVLAGLLCGFGFWAYKLMLLSLAKSGWLDEGFLRDGLFGLALLKPEAFLGLSGMDGLTHSLF